MQAHNLAILTCMLAQKASAWPACAQILKKRVRVSFSRQFLKTRVGVNIPELFPHLLSGLRTQQISAQRICTEGKANCLIHAQAKQYKGYLNSALSVHHQHAPEGNEAPEAFLTRCFLPCTVFEVMIDPYLPHDTEACLCCLALHNAFADAVIAVSFDLPRAHYRNMRKQLAWITGEGGEINSAVRGKQGPDALVRFPALMLYLITNSNQKGVRPNLKK
eukprot:1148379-Pelagomonas_calceolata.AAC.2